MTNLTPEQKDILNKVANISYYDSFIIDQATEVYQVIANEAQKLSTTDKKKACTWARSYLIDCPNSGLTLVKDFIIAGTS